jgi:adenine-specific DNA-methyltransferase
LFPSSFFPGVNFGYANLSIITLQKCDDINLCFKHIVKVINGFTSVEQLSDLSDSDLKVSSFSQEEIYNNPDHAFLISENTKIIQLINNPTQRIGEIANCVTGFYSGDDKTFLKVNSPALKNGKNYNIVDEESVNREYTSLNEILDGIDGERYFIPIVKGGNVKYLKPEGWFMNWGKQAVKHYKTDKKARFQNSQFYFKFGIGIPMISSSSITASLIENKLFDQSIVGIFPKDQSLTYYLLAFFNSTTCNTLIRTINPSANNPANYIKKIPFISPDPIALDRISNAVSQILYSLKSCNTYDEHFDSEINSHFREIYGF